VPSKRIEFMLQGSAASQGWTVSSIHQALDGLDELLEREGLRQEHEILAFRQIAREGVVGVAGDENDLAVNPRLRSSVSMVGPSFPA